MDLWWREDCALTVHQIMTGVESVPSLKPLCNKELSRVMVKLFEEEANLPVQNLLINLVNFAKASQATEDFSLIPYSVAPESETVSVMSYETMSNGGTDLLSDSSNSSVIDLEEESRSISEEELAVVSKLGTKLKTERVLHFATPALNSKIEPNDENEEEETQSYCSIITVEEQDSNFDNDEELAAPTIAVNEEQVCVVQVEKLEVHPVVSAVNEPCTMDIEPEQEDLSTGVYYHTTPNVRSIQPALQASLQQVIQQLTPVTEKSILLSGISSFVLSNAPLISNTYNKVVAEFKQSVFVNVELADSGSKLKQQKAQPKFNLFEAARRIVDTISDMN